MIPIPTRNADAGPPWVVWAARPCRFWQPLILSAEADEAHAVARMLRRSCTGQRFAVRKACPPLTPNS